MNKMKKIKKYKNPCRHYTLHVDYCDHEGVGRDYILSAETDNGAVIQANKLLRKLKPAIIHHKISFFDESNGKSGFL